MTLRNLLNGPAAGGFPAGRKLSTAIVRYVTVPNRDSKLTPENIFNYPTDKKIVT